MRNNNAAPRAALSAAMLAIGLGLALGASPLGAGVAAATPNNDKIVLSFNSFRSGDPYLVVDSNRSFVEGLLAELIYPEEIQPESLRSYYAEFYYSRMSNGGFAEFVQQSEWDPKMIAVLRDGLQKMGASRHLAVLNKGAAQVQALGAPALKAFIEQTAADDAAIRERLNSVNDDFAQAAAQEDLTALNGTWLRNFLHLKIMSVSKMNAEVAARAAEIPDREARIQKRLDKEPRHMKLIRALAREADQEFGYFDAGDPTASYGGKSVIAWHFVTDKGAFYMIEADGQALMFNKKTDEKIAEIAAPK